MSELLPSVGIPAGMLERVTIAEAASRLGTTRQNLTNLRVRHEDFPPHDPDVSGARVYVWRDLKEWFEARGER